MRDPYFPPLPDICPNTPENIDKILDEIISTRDGGTRRYLIRWKGKSPAEDTWLDRSELQKIDPDLLEYYESSFTRDSTKSSFLPHGENDGDMASARPRGNSIACISAGGVELLLFEFSWSLYFIFLVLFILFIFSVLVPHRLCGKTPVNVSLFNWL